MASDLEGRFPFAIVEAPAGARPQRLGVGPTPWSRSFPGRRRRVNYRDPTMPTEFRAPIVWLWR